ncbi:hypothetical protein JB92DRAFT_3037988 [Gautieria morchelliformis]|nr:hypothetical protein JB92DRAFT_3037988 [Gautieria morchelliformis]
MVHPRLKRILSEPSPAVSSPPDTSNDPESSGKPEQASEDLDPEVNSQLFTNPIDFFFPVPKEEQCRPPAPFVSPGCKMDKWDEDSDGAPELGEEDKVPVADVDATQKSGADVRSRNNKQSSRSIMSPPSAEGGTPSTAAAPVVARDKSPDPPPRQRQQARISTYHGPGRRPQARKQSTSQHSTKDFKDTSPIPPSTSASANRSPASRPRPSLKIKLKLGARDSKGTSEAEAGEERTTRGRRGRASESGKEKAKGNATRPLTFTLPPRPRTDPSEGSSISRSQSSEHSSVESEDEAEDADAESEDENNAHPDQEELDDDVMDVDADAMDVDVDAPGLSGRLADDVESEDDGDIPNDDTDDSEGDEGEVLPGGGTGRLTARQAVLASMIGADHIELEPATSSRKKQRTSEEIALKRQENARKRKNLSEKKLEDEKTETINRLLRKQSSRSKAKRSAFVNTSIVPTPQSPHSGDGGESDGVLGAVPGTTGQMGMPGPVWRWVSNSSGIRLGVPSEVVDIRETMGDAAKMVAASNALDMKPRPPAICNVPGCREPRKYRLVHDFEQGACGMEHLRVLSSGDK